MSFTSLHLGLINSIIYKEVLINSRPGISEFHLIVQKSSICVARVLKFGVYFAHRQVTIGVIVAPCRVCFSGDIH